MADKKKKDWFTDSVLKQYGVVDESELAEKYGLKIRSSGWGPFQKRLLVKVDRASQPPK